MENEFKMFPDIKHQGIEELFNEIITHKEHLHKSGFIDVKRKEQLTKKIFDLVHNKLELSFWNEKRKSELSDKIGLISKRENDPYTFVNNIIK